MILLHWLLYGVGDGNKITAYELTDQVLNAQSSHDTDGIHNSRHLVTFICMELTCSGQIKHVRLE